jgi:hypothetical protein
MADGAISVADPRLSAWSNRVEPELEDSIGTCPAMPSMDLPHLSCSGGLRWSKACKGVSEVGVKLLLPPVLDGFSVQIRQIEPTSEAVNVVFFDTPKGVVISLFANPLKWDSMKADFQVVAKVGR